MEVGVEPRARQSWTRRDLTTLGALALVAAAAIAIGLGGAVRVQPIAGLALILAIAYCLSSARHAIDYRTVAWGLTLQGLFAVVVLKTEAGRLVFQQLGALMTRLLNFTYVGSSFVFGPLGDPEVWPRIMTGVLGEEGSRYANIFAFMVLPTIIFIAALFAMLYYFGVMQIDRPDLRDRHAPLHARQRRRVAQRRREHLHGADRGAVDDSPLPAAHDRIGADDRDDRRDGAHLGRRHGGLHPVRRRGAAPADRGDHDRTRHADDGEAVRPRNRAARDERHGKLEVEQTDVNVIDAIGRGTGEGLRLALNVGAMLISFLALIALVNALLGLVGLSMQQIFGWVFAPIAWSLGVPWRDAPTIGNLLGTRMVLNEFVAYSQLGPLKDSLDPKSFTIATYALCGFANFSSIGIQIGGIGALAPERRHDLARLGIRAMLAGTLANFVTATIAGMLL